MIPASFRNARSEVRRTSAVGFGVHHPCSENAVVTIWLLIGADVILERSTCEWGGQDKSTGAQDLPSKGYLTESRAPLMAMD